MSKTNETTRWINAGIMAACYLADVAMRPWAVASINSEYRRNARTLIAKYAAEDARR